MSTPLTATQSQAELQRVALPLPLAIVRLAWPTIASLMVVNLFNLVDAYWVGLLGTRALGGMTAAAFLVWCVHAVGILVGTGVNALVARRVGEGRPGDAGVAGAHGLILAGALALLAMVAGLMLQDTLFRALHLEAAVQGLAVAYLTPMLLGMPAIIGWYAIEAIFRGSGDTFTPMWIISLSLGLNMILDPLLIFGVGPFPALGIAGAAWATIFAHALAIMGCVWKLRRGPLRPRFFSRGRSLLRLAIFGRLLRVGSPVAASGLLFSMIYLFLTRLIADFGSASVAAVGIGHRVEGFGYYICVGFAAAAATLVGQSLGAGEPARAERAAWRATVYATAIVGLISLLTYLFAAPIMAIFAHDPQVVAAGDRYLKIIALLEAGMALEVVLEGAFAGAGNSLPPMIVSIPLTLLRIPVAFFLIQRIGFGIEAIWWVISVSTAAKGILIGVWFRRGRWKSVKL